MSIAYIIFVIGLIPSFLALLVHYMTDSLCYVFFFQAEDGIRDIGVTGVQTCALPIFGSHHRHGTELHPRLQACQRSTVLHLLEERWWSLGSLREVHRLPGRLADDFG